MDIEFLEKFRCFGMGFGDDFKGIFLGCVFYFFYAANLFDGINHLSGVVVVDVASKVNDDIYFFIECTKGLAANKLYCQDNVENENDYGNNHNCGYG